MRHLALFLLLAAPSVAIGGEYTARHIGSPDGHDIVLLDISNAGWAVGYEEFSTDNTLNQAVLASIRVLIGLVRDGALRSQLRVQGG